MQRALESALAELALGPPISAADPAALSAWLDRHQVSAVDREPLLRDFERLLIYRRLVRNNLKEALRATIPRTLARLGPLFDEYFDAYLLATPPSTHYLRDVTRDFLAHALPRWQTDARVPAYLGELAEHEALQIELASLRARPKHHVLPELVLDENVESIDAVRLVDYAWRVHELSEDAADTRAPEHAPARLLVYRSPEHDVRYLELSPFARALTRALFVERLTLRVAIASASRELERPADDAFLSAAAALLAELAERGVLLGRAPTEPANAALAEKNSNSGKNSA
ncbi:MAG TPA: putative DNA-binding domain-containing protein [Polyangiaceae bacterium]|jgi:hypothetical protein